MKRKIIITLLCLLFVSISGKAMDYITAVGLRAGLSNGITAKHFVTQNAALEGIAAAHYDHGAGFAVLYEVHDNIETKGLYWYYGGGAHIGMWDNEGTMGIDGIIGMEYNFMEAPINISIDWKPAIHLAGSTGFWGYGVALSIRYRLQ